VRVVLPGDYSEESLEEFRKIVENHPDITKVRITTEEALLVKLQKRSARRFKQFFPSVLNHLIDAIDSKNRRAVSPGSIRRQSRKKDRFVNKKTKSALVTT
jgi:hypothetical protein